MCCASPSPLWIGVCRRPIADAGLLSQSRRFHREQRWYRDIDAAEVAIEVWVRLGAFDPGRTTLEIELTGEGDAAGPWRRTPVDGGLLLTERFAGERLTAVVANARLPLRTAYEHDLRVLVRLDADGSGRHTVPKDGDFLEVPVPGDLGDFLSEAQWQTVTDADRARRSRAPIEGAD